MPEPGPTQEEPTLASTKEKPEEAPAKLDRAKDYSWVQGKLMKVHARGGYWQVRYASHEQPDEHGGRFVLLGASADNYKDGDLVRIQGDIVGYDERLRATKYRATSVKLVERNRFPLAN